MTFTHGRLKKILWIYCFLVFTVKPLAAQTIPANFHEWFNEQTAGKPANQFTLEALHLPCVGAAITPPNASGAKSKIWDPQTKLWTRVIEGDPIQGGSWTWVITDQGPAPVLTAAELAYCTAPPAASVPPHIPPAIQSTDLTPLVSLLNSIIAAQQEQREARERIFANETAQIQALSAQLKAHDEKTSAIVSFFSNRYVQLALTGIGTYLGARMAP